MGLRRPGEIPLCRPLDGGVSSEIWLVELPGRRLCLKRALPRLRVAQLWEAPVIRNHYEAAWFRVAGTICPEAVPQLLGEDAADGLFAMEYLDPGAYPVWKHLLRDGHADPASRGCRSASGWPASMPRRPAMPRSRATSPPTTVSTRSASSRI